MKRPILFDQDAVLAALDTRKLTPKQKASRPTNVLPAFENVAGEKKKKTARMYLYDAVSYWTGNDARTFQRMLSESNAEEIHLHINSPGGSVFEGVTIFNLLADHPADVVVHIDGLAASIASVIALAGDTVNIAENGMIMIHNPSVIAWGDAEVMRKQAEILDQIKEAILNTYESRTALHRTSLSSAMDAETWYSADEAITAGFASAKFSPPKASALWLPGDYDLPEAAAMLAKPAEEEMQEEEPPARPAHEFKGSLEDVQAAADRIAQLRQLHGL